MKGMSGANRWALFCVVAQVVLAFSHFSAMASAAEPKLTRFYPPTVGRGQNWTVTAEGTFADWPVDVHVFPPQLQVKCLEKKGQVELTAAADCPSGRYWVRFSTPEGWSDPQPIIVSAATAYLESKDRESANNDRLNLETHQELPAMFVGKLEKSGDVDCYTVPVKAGQTLSVSVTSNEIFASPADCVLQIVSPQGFVLAQNDDERNLDPMVHWTAEVDGLVAIRVFCFPVAPNSTIAFAGGGDYMYLLEATLGGYFDYTIPLAAGSNAASAKAVGWNLAQDSVQLTPTVDALGGVTFAANSGSNSIAGWFQPEQSERTISVISEESEGATLELPLELPIDASGQLEKDGDVDHCLFVAKKGSTYTIEVQSRRFRLATDPKVSVLTSDGKSLAAGDDIARDKRDVLLKWKSAADQTVRLEIRDAHDRGGLRFGYRVLVTEETPKLTMTAAKDWLVTDPAKGGQFDINLAWENGLKQALEVQAIDREGKVIATASVAAAAKKVTLNVPHQGGTWKPVTIQSKIGEEPPSTLRFQKSGLPSRVVWMR